MAATQLAFSVADYPTEMVAAAAFEGARDADRVCRFLRYLGLDASPDRPRLMPPNFLLHLGAALRLLVWEVQGFFFHRAAGLPEARQAIRDAVLSLNNPNADSTELCQTVFRLSIERFAWSGPPELGVDVTLDEAQEDMLLNALADFLWTNRTR
jgi:hypothetical protein